MVFDGSEIVPVKGPSLVKILQSRLKLRDSTNGPDEYKSAARRRLDRSALSENPLPGDGLAAGNSEANLSSNFDSGASD